MITSAAARRRNLPSTQTTQELGSLEAGTALSGRWVRGHDGQSRWLKLADGSYVWEGNLVEPGGPGSPIAIPFTNANFSFGREISGYLDQARATAASRIARADALPEKERLQRLDALETMSTFVRVPNRRYLGLTVVGVGQHYESSSIYFREGPAAVIAAFRANGVKLADDGVVAGASDEPESCSINAVQSAEEGALGATALTCGV